jgi:hypothetical protein
MRPGITILVDAPGTGDLVQRQRAYRIRLRMWLNRGEPVRWTAPFGFVDRAVQDNGETMITDVRLHRENFISGLFYGVEGMRLGGTRRLEISPHLAYGDRGIPGIVPANAVLTAEITFLEERDLGFRRPTARTGQPEGH